MPTTEFEYRPPIKDDVSNVVHERHHYVRPNGEKGYVDYEYKIVGANLMLRATHVGTEPGMPNHDFMIVPELDIQELQTIGTNPVTYNVVKIVETTPGSGIFDKQIVVQETHNEPILGMVTVTQQHPYRARFFTP